MRHCWNENQRFNTEIVHLSTNPVRCSLQVGTVSLKQVETFKHIGVAFTSDGRQDEELDLRSAKIVMQALQHSIDLKR